MLIESFFLSMLYYILISKEDRKTSETGTKHMNTPKVNTFLHRI